MREKKKQEKGLRRSNPALCRRMALTAVVPSPSECNLALHLILSTSGQPLEAAENKDDPRNEHLCSSYFA